MRRISRSGRLGVLFSLLGIFALVGGVAFAAGVISCADGLIHGCYDNRSGALRAIDPSVSRCKSSETAIRWDQTGPQGPQGDVGPEGPAAVPYERTMAVSPVGTAAENGQAPLEALAGISSAWAWQPLPAEDRGPGCTTWGPLSWP